MRVCVCHLPFPCGLRGRIDESVAPSDYRPKQLKKKLFEKIATAIEARLGVRESVRESVCDGDSSREMKCGVGMWARE